MFQVPDCRESFSAIPVPTFRVGARLVSQPENHKTAPSRKIHEKSNDFNDNQPDCTNLMTLGNKKKPKINHLRRPARVEELC